MYEEPESWYALSKIDPELDSYVKTLEGGAPKSPEDYDEHKKFIAELSKRNKQSHDVSEIHEEDVTVEARDGYRIPIRVHSPAKSNEAGPLLIFIHGGGFCVGTIDTDIVTPRNCVKHFGAVAVTIDYRLAPEHPFPIPVLDCWDVVQWVARNAKSLNADTSKGFILGGNSAGGGMAAVIAVLARDAKLEPKITGLCQLVPAIGSPEKDKPLVKSYQQNEDAMLLPKEDMHKYIVGYQPDWTSPLFTVFGSGTSLEGLPPVYLQICGMDPMRDDAFIYERVLRLEYSIPTKMDVYPGLPHWFWEFFPQLESSKKFFQDTINGMEWLLKQ